MFQQKNSREFITFHFFPTFRRNFKCFNKNKKHNFSGHCCPVICPLNTTTDTRYSCDPDAAPALKCPSDSHYCYFLSGNFNKIQNFICNANSDGSFSQAACCRRPCNAMAPNALYVDYHCMPRGQLNSACTSNAQCGGGEGMECMKGQCQCQQNFHPAVDVLTNPLKNPSQSCSRDCESENLSKDTSCMKVREMGQIGGRFVSR